MLVAVTCFDSFYVHGQCSSEGRNPTKDETKQKFAKLSSVTKAENVFPLCSIWALEGRIMKHLAEKDNKKKGFIQYSLFQYNGEGMSEWMPEMSDAIIKASGIEQLEERYSTK